MGDACDPNAWYVSETTGSDTTGEGSQAKPFATITKAISLSSYRDLIKVAAGSYDEFVSLDDERSLVGGFDPVTWEKNIPVFQTIFSGTISSDLLNNSPSIEGFIIQNSNKGISFTNMYGSISNSIIRNNTIGVFLDVDYGSAGDFLDINFGSFYYSFPTNISNTLVYNNNTGIATNIDGDYSNWDDKCPGFCMFYFLETSARLYNVTMANNGTNIDIGSFTDSCFALMGGFASTSVYMQNGYDPF